MVDLRRFVPVGRLWERGGVGGFKELPHRTLSVVQLLLHERRDGGVIEGKEGFPVVLIAVDDRVCVCVCVLQESLDPRVLNAGEITRDEEEPSRCFGRLVMESRRETP